MSIEPTLIAAMDCSEIERSIDPYIDGEFDAREHADVDAHLAVCPLCRGRVEAQIRMRAALRAKLREALGQPQASQAPAALRARIESALVRRRTALWRRMLAPIPLSALAACATGVLIVLWWHSADNALVEDAISKHHRGPPLEVRFDGERPGPGALFDKQLDFKPVLPHFRTAGVLPIGARLSHVREWPAAYVLYQLPRGQAGLFIVDDPQGRFGASGREIRIGPHTIHLVNARGYNVVVWRQDEIVYSLVSDLDENALFQLVQAAQGDTVH